MSRYCHNRSEWIVNGVMPVSPMTVFLLGLRTSVNFWLLAGAAAPLLHMRQLFTSDEEQIRLGDNLLLDRLGHAVDERQETNSVGTRTGDSLCEPLQRGVCMVFSIHGIRALMPERILPGLVIQNRKRPREEFTPTQTTVDDDDVENEEFDRLQRANKSIATPETLPSQDAAVIVGHVAFDPLRHEEIDEKKFPWWMEDEEENEEKEEEEEDEEDKSEEENEDEGD